MGGREDGENKRVSTEGVGDGGRELGVRGQRVRRGWGMRGRDKRRRGEGEGLSTRGKRDEGMGVEKGEKEWVWGVGGD